MSKEWIIRFYSKLYTKIEVWRPQWDGLLVNCISDKDRVGMEGKFEKEEVVEALRDMSMDKASRPNGFVYQGIFSKMLECGSQRCD